MNKDQIRQEGVSSTKFRRRMYLGIAASLLGGASIALLWFISGRGQPELRIIADGPFSDEKPVSLKDYRSSFVQPRSIRVGVRDSRTAKVQLMFSFKGVQNASRQIQTEIRLRNHEGEIVGTRQVICNDARIDADKPVMGGSVYLTSSPDNCVTVVIPLRKPSSIASVEVLFKPA